MEDFTAAPGHESISWSEPRSIDDAKLHDHHSEATEGDLSNTGTLKVVESEAREPTPDDQGTASQTGLAERGKASGALEDAQSPQQMDAEQQYLAYEEQVQHLRLLEREIADRTAEFHERTKNLEEEAEELREDIEKHMLLLWG